MTTETGVNGGTVDKLLAMGQAVIDNVGKINQVSLSAGQQIIDAQIGLAKAFVDFGSSQVGTIGGITAPAAFLQRQKEIGETLVGQMTGYFEGLRGIGVEAQSGYSAVARDLASAAGLTTA
jgi:hypothetical protein